MHFAGSTRGVAPVPGPVGLVLAIVLAGLTGCSSSQDPYEVPLSDSEKNLKHIAMAYSDAHAQLGRGPKNADDLKPFLQVFGDPNALLVSPSDGQPYIVIWGATPSGGPGEYEGLFPILAYERKGANGKRAVTDIRGRPMTIPEEDLHKLRFLGRHKPS